MPQIHSTLVLNKLADYFPPKVVEYHQIGIYNRVLSRGEVATIYYEIDQSSTAPVIVPNLLFDVNFNDSSLDVDYTIDGSALVFEPSNAANVTAEDGFVTISAGNHVK
jgi:hypothetical protein